METGWIKPTGRTQIDIDAEAVKEVEAIEKQKAQEYLQATDQDVLEAVELHLQAEYQLKSEFVERRQLARRTLRGEGNAKK